MPPLDMAAYRKQQAALHASEAPQVRCCWAFLATCALPLFWLSAVRELEALQLNPSFPFWAKGDVCAQV